MAIIALVTERTAAEVEQVKRQAFKGRSQAKQPAPSEERAAAETASDDTAPDDTGAADAAAEQKTSPPAQEEVGGES
jgi:hypothetical protein